MCSAPLEPTTRVLDRPSQPVSLLSSSSPSTRQDTQVNSPFTDYFTITQMREGCRQGLATATTMRTGLVQPQQKCLSMDWLNLPTSSGFEITFGDLYSQFNLRVPNVFKPVQFSFTRQNKPVAVMLFSVQSHTSLITLILCIAELSGADAWDRQEAREEV